MIGKLYGPETVAWRVVEELFERLDSIENRVGELKIVLESIDNKLFYIQDNTRNQIFDAAVSQNQMNELLKESNRLKKISMMNRRNSQSSLSLMCIRSVE